jgi:hypothetical protein
VLVLDMIEIIPLLEKYKYDSATLIILCACGAAYETSTTQRGWCMWHYHEGHMRMKLKMDTTGCIGPCYSYFVVFNILGHRAF